MALNIGTSAKERSCAGGVNVEGGILLSRRQVRLTDGQPHEELFGICIAWASLLWQLVYLQLHTRKLAT